LAIVVWLLSFPQSIKAQLPFVKVTSGSSRPLPGDYFGQNASDIIYSRSLDDEVLHQKVSLISPGTIRHVASSPSNWWDWRSGWLLQDKDILPGFEIRDDWAILTPQQDKIADLKYMVDTTGAKVIFVPNMLTSRLDYQVAALFEFAYRNVLTPYVEMGCEFYLDNNESYERFPTSIQYADTASQWIEGFRKLFPGLKIAMIGATEQLANVSGRRNSWTENVVSNGPVTTLLRFMPIFRQGLIFRVIRFQRVHYQHYLQSHSIP
jgi:hypothetical protein